jgi:Acetyltransferase (GNAT) domain
MYFVYGALRGNPSNENCALMVDEILRSLSAGEADVAYLNFLKQESDICKLALRKPSLFTRDHVRLTQSHFAAALPVTVTEYYRSLPSESKGFNKARHKKLLKDFAGRIKIKCYREPAEIDTMAQDIEQIAKTSYQRGLGVGFKDTPEMREALRMMATKGWLRGYVLYLAERPCAFWIGDVNQGVFGSDYIGFDAQLGRYSPGMYLTTQVIEGFCDGNSEGVTGIDFGPGDAQYKEVLSNQKWQEAAVHIFAPSLKGVYLNAFSSIVGRTDSSLKKLLVRTNLLSKIKKAWRERAKPKEALQAGA